MVLDITCLGDTFSLPSMKRSVGDSLFFQPFYNEGSYLKPILTRDVSFIKKYFGFIIHRQMSRQSLVSSYLIFFVSWRSYLWYRCSDRSDNLGLVFFFLWFNHSKAEAIYGRWRLYFFNWYNDTPQRQLMVDDFKGSRSYKRL